MTQIHESQFDDLANLYEDMSSWPFRRDIEIPSVMQLLGGVQGLDVLDFGCGSAFYSRMLKARGARRVVGYDEAGGMLRYAQRREEKERLGIEFTTALTPNFDRQFDLVLAVYVLPYASTEQMLHAMCARIGKLLRPGGRLVTLPIHPAYEPRPEYYEPYGFRLRAANDDPYTEGGEVRLELCRQHYEANVSAWYWSVAAFERALKAAGFASVDWKDPVPPGMQSVDAAPEELKAYLRKPHSILMDCRLA
ncbi:class I SAM-dependent methyltransferase [Burkholderia dolosa]|uniref:class I SAM-dependent methyltransferase n=1 Tax=Burkholderia dolosa TaxID=152500 RepID=UPI0015917B7B|nr:class I SAM-dependent methyltransferase [Burkholderia dolosa]MBR8299347.1 class I SAM-dependent methyltransferase [Burkholderia dolosa]MBR8456393.1 class I SAM-dependent methyltransferase [Burkholderia dolosa]MDN7422155.1 methyltransferase domain-containing protein [Burkholderia dolosa]